MTGGSPRRAAIVGTGLIGGSIGLGLRGLGWYVTGTDRDPCAEDKALEAGAIDAVGRDPSAEITFVATPAGATVDEVRGTLAETAGLVTDVAGVKASIAEAVEHPRFVAGHPMAGSEQVGMDGADADLFRGAVWVLTPTGSTADETYLGVRSVLAELGADVVSMPPDRHDSVVAVVSHVPHLTAATLMGLASARAVDDRVLLRLAAGGFRDMTRVAAGHPGLWPDICAENSEAIVDTLDSVILGLTELRLMVADHDRDALFDLLEGASDARRSLPPGLPPGTELGVVRIPIADEPGMIAEVTTLATDLGINILDLEIAHSAEGDRGVLIMVVPSEGTDELQDGLEARGLKSSVRGLP